MLSAHEILADGHRLANKLSNTTGFALGVQTCDQLSSTYDRLLGVVKKDAGPVTALGLRKADVVYQKLQVANWKLCQLIFRTIGPSKGIPFHVKVDHPNASTIRQYVGDFQQLVCKGPVPDTLTIKHVSQNGHTKGFGRSYYSDDKDAIFLRDNAGRGTVWHELGHWLEHKTPGLQPAVEEYLASRTKGEQAKKLKDPERPGYTLMERAKADGFPQPYCGKLYSDGGTELLSMGLQYMVEAPAVLWLEDKGLFSFTLGCINATRGIL